MRAFRHSGDDAGVALVTAVAFVFVMLLLSIVLFTVTRGNILSSASDRSRVQGTSGAEAGIDELNITLQDSPPDQLPCQLSQTLTNGESFTATVAYFAASPPSAATRLACTQGAGVASPPASAVILSQGTAPAAGGRQVVETMEEQVGLRTVYQAFTDAVYTSRTLENQRTLTIYGQNGSNGDVYTGGNWQCLQGDQIDGSVNAAGYAALGGNCHVAGSVWANGPVSATNADSISGSATSSSSCVVLNSGGSGGMPGGTPLCTPGGGAPSRPGSGSSAIIGGNAVAGTTCTYASSTCGPPEVGGTVTQFHTQPPPPAQGFPIVAFNPADWTSQGYAVDTFAGSTACTDAENAIDSGFGSTPTVVNVVPDCALIWSRSGPGLAQRGVRLPSGASTCAGGSGYGIKLGANLAIVTNGPIFLDHDVTFCSASSAPVRLFLLVPDTQQNQDACVYAGAPGTAPPSAWDKLSQAGNTSSNNPDNNPAGQTSWTTQLQVTSPDLDSEDNTTFIGVDAVYYTPCTVDMEDPTLTGQIYAGSVVLENKLTLHYQPIIIPGNGVPIGNKVDIAYLRQVAPGTKAS